MEKMKLLSERLAWAVDRYVAANPDALKVSKRRLAHEAGVSPPAVNYWYADVNGIQAPAARRLAEFLRVDPVWLEKGEGSPDIPQRQEIEGARQVVAADQDDPDFLHIPMVKLRLSAGITGFHAEQDHSQGSTLSMRRNWFERTGLRASSLIAIQVKGESMEPSLYEDDIVIINTSDVRPKDGVVFAVNYEGEAVIKRLSRDGGDWWLTSDSPDQRKHHRKVCRGDACIIIGRVVHKESDRI